MGGTAAWRRANRARFGWHRPGLALIALALSLALIVGQLPRGPLGGAASAQEQDEDWSAPFIDNYGMRFERRSRPLVDLTGSWTPVAGATRLDLNTDGFAEESSLDTAGWLCQEGGDRYSFAKNGCYYNWPRHLLDRMELELVDWRIRRQVWGPLATHSARWIELDYEGTYEHVQTFLRRLYPHEAPWDGDPIPYGVNAACHYEPRTYRLSGTLTYRLSGPPAAEDGRMFLDLHGSMTSDPGPYQMFPDISIQGMFHPRSGLPWIDPQRYEPSRGWWDSAPPPGPDEHDLWVTFGGGAIGRFGHEATLPPGCDGYAEYFMDLPVGDAPGENSVRMTVRHVADPVDVRGWVSGQVVDAETGDPLDVAPVELLERRTVDGEAVLELVDASPGERGRFSFHDLPLFRRLPGGGSEPRRYVVRAHGGERAVPAGVVGHPVRQYGGKEVQGTPYEELKIAVPMQPEVTAKRGLVERLKALSPDTYGPVEEQVAQYLNTLTGDLSERDIEALRRAIWAERVAVEVANSVEGMTKKAATQLGELLVMVFSALFETRRADIAEAQRRKQAAEDLGQDGHRAATEALAQHRQGIGPITPEQSRQYWQESSLLARQIEDASFLKGALGAMATTVSTQLKTFGVKAETAGKFGAWLKFALDSVFDYVQTRTVRGAAKSSFDEIVKRITSYLGPVLFDGRVVVGQDAKDPAAALLDVDLPGDFGFTALGRPTLEYSRDRMPESFTPDADGYLADAEATAELLNAYTADWAATSRRIAYIDATASSSAGVASVFGFIPGPKAKAINVVATWLQRVATGASFVEPMLFAFGRSPGLQQRGVCAAWGAQEAAASLWSAESPGDVCDPAGMALASTGDGPTLQSAEFAAELAAEMTAAGDAFAAATDELLAALAEDDLGKALGVVLGDAYDAAWEDVAASSEAFELLLEADAAARGTDRAAVERFANARTILRAWRVAALGALDDLVAAVEDRVFAATADPRYEVLRSAVEHATARWAATAELVGEIGEELAAAGPTGAAVLVRVAPPRSATTGATLVGAPGERFTVRASVRNVSGGALSDLSAVLSAAAGRDGVTIEGPAERDIGTLAAGATTTLEWTITHSGDADADAMPLAVEVRESDGPPTSFVGGTGAVTLFLDDELATDPAAATTLASSHPERTVDPAEIVLTAEQPATVATISGGGRFHIESDHPHLVRFSPSPGQPRSAGALIIHAAPDHAFDATVETLLRLVDEDTGAVDEVPVVLRGRDDEGRGLVRLSGTGRETTAAQISQARFPQDFSAEAVVLARSDSFADGLAGTPLAARLNAPLLLTGSTSLHPDTEAEITRVLGGWGATVHVLGGEAAIAPSVVAQLQALGYRVERVAGPTRQATAVAIARRLGDVRVAFIARGDDFPDALAAGPPAALLHGAIVLSAGDRPHPETDAYLATLGPEVERIAVGGHAARAYPSATAIAGPGREETAVAVARAMFGDAPLSVAVVRRDAFADALTGGAHVGLAVGPVLLTSSGHLHPATAAYLGQAAAVRRAFVYGGQAAVSDPTATAIGEALPGL